MAGERVFLPRGVLTESSVGSGWSSLWLSCHFSLLGDEEFLPRAAQGESAGCSLPTLPSVSLPSQVFGLTVLPAAGPLSVLRQKENSICGWAWPGA